MKNLKAFLEGSLLSITKANLAVIYAMTSILFGLIFIFLYLFLGADFLQKESIYIPIKKTDRKAIVLLYASLENAEEKLLQFAFDEFLKGDKADKKRIRDIQMWRARGDEIREKIKPYLKYNKDKRRGIFQIKK